MAEKKWHIIKILQYKPYINAEQLSVAGGINFYSLWLYILKNVTKL